MLPFCYQDRLFSQRVRDLTCKGFSGWRKLFLERLARIAERCPSKVPVDLEALTDMANALVDDCAIQSRVMRDKAILPQQIMLHRDFVRTVCLGV